MNATAANQFARPALSDPRASGELARLAKNPQYRVQFGLGPVKDGALNALLRRGAR